MKAGKFIDGVHYSWAEIYDLTGLCQEDFLYDTSGECYHLLIKAIKGKESDMLQQRLLDIPLGYEMVLAVDYSVQGRTYPKGTKIVRSEGYGCAGYLVSFTFLDGFSDWLGVEEIEEKGE